MAEGLEEVNSVQESPTQVSSLESEEATEDSPISRLIFAGVIVLAVLIFSATIYFLLTKENVVEFQGENLTGSHGPGYIDLEGYFSCTLDNAEVIASKMIQSIKEDNFTEYLKVTDNFDLEQASDSFRLDKQNLNFTDFSLIDKTDMKEKFNNNSLEGYWMEYSAYRDGARFRVVITTQLGVFDVERCVARFGSYSNY